MDWEEKHPTLARTARLRLHCREGAIRNGNDSRIFEIRHVREDYCLGDDRVARGGISGHRLTRARRPLRGHRKPAQEPDRRPEGWPYGRQRHLSVAPAGKGTFARLRKPEIQQRTLRQG